MPLLRLRQCAGCGLDFELFEQNGKVSVFDRDDDLMICPYPGCGQPVETATAKIGGIPIATKWDNKKYDMGAGRTFESASERNRWMKKKGLVALDGAARSMADDWARQQTAANEAHAKVRADQARAIDACPETKRALDQIQEDIRHAQSVAGDAAKRRREAALESAARRKRR